MSDYARIVDDAIAEVRDFAMAPDPNPDKGFDWRPFTRTRPAFDAATQVLEGPEDIVTAGGAERRWTVRDKTAQELADDLTAKRDATTARFDQKEEIERAIALVLLDAFNAQSAKMAEVVAAVGAATSLADLRSRMGAITVIPQRTPAQLRTAIRAKLGDGDA